MDVREYFLLIAERNRWKRIACACAGVAIAQIAMLIIFSR